jgi:sodium transport system permease protein
MSDPQPASPVQPLAHAAVPRFRWARQWRLTMKELAETLRDRRTIATLILMPILVYPLMSVAFRTIFVATEVTTSASSPLVLGMENEDDRNKLDQMAAHGNQLLEEAARNAAPFGGQGDEGTTKTENVVVEVVPDVMAAIRSGRVDAGVRFITPDEANAPVQVKVIFREDSARSDSIREYIERRIRVLNVHLLQQRLAKLNQDPVLPVTSAKLAVVQGSPMRAALPTLIPLMLLLMTITGAVYPAIDLTAGERERGTLEALVAAPVSRVEVLSAKFIAVLTVALLTAVVNLVSMCITLISTGLGGFLFGSDGLTPVLFLKILGLLVLFASFFSAILLAITSFARSFKEAQAYLIPLMLVSMAPGLATLMPDLQLSGWLAVTPLVNIVLLTRDVLANSVDYRAAVTTIVSTLMYTAVAVALAAKIFGSDSILYGSQGSWGDVFRRPRRESPAISPFAALLTLAVIYALFVTAGSGWQFFALGELAPGQSLDVARFRNYLLGSVAISLGLFIVVPLITAHIHRVRPSHAIGGLSWNPVTLLGALCLGVSLCAFAYESVIIADQLKLTPVSDLAKEKAKELTSVFNSLPHIYVLFCLAIVPAVSEEFFFRGFLYRSLRQKRSAFATILITASIFAAFHVFSPGGLTIVRFVPSFILGLALGYLAESSGSIIPSTLMHVVNNCLMLSLDKLRPVLEKWGLGGEAEHLPAAWLAGAAAFTTVGLALVWVSRRRANSSPFDQADSPVATTS